MKRGNEVWDGDVRRRTLLKLGFTIRVRTVGLSDRFGQSDKLARIGPFPKSG